jgi:hypothetical protein
MEGLSLYLLLTNTSISSFPGGHAGNAWSILSVTAPTSCFQCGLVLLQHFAVDDQQNQSEKAAAEQ